MTPNSPGAERVVVGLMSGTSLDGIAAAVVRFTPNERGVNPDILAFRTVAYSGAQRQQLESALRGDTPEAYCRLDFDLGHWLSDAALTVIADAGVARADIAAIASHGQTIWHVPGHSTWQLGQSAVIAERTRIPVVSDFRVRDVAAGGQGAPLVPMADAMLFSHPTEWRALQNLGGIGNVTIVPPKGDPTGVRAFDTGPGVVLIDGVTRALVPNALYDKDGSLAQRGTEIHQVVASYLLDVAFFSEPPPKSTGRELFTPAFISSFIDECRRQRPEARTEDIIATAVLLTAGSIAVAFQHFVPEPVREVLLSGGGSKNPTLVQGISDALWENGPISHRVRRFSEVFFDDEAKEAVAFALLGYLFLEGRPGNLPRVTGAVGPRILGKLTPA